MKILAALCLALAALQASAQIPRPTDVDSVEHLTAAVYDVISGPAGAPRDWDRFRSLFYPETGRMISSGRNADGTVYLRNLTPEDYVARAGKMFETTAFFETPVATRSEVWDHFAELWSTYESRHAKDEKPFARGINNFQMIHDGKRWWIVSIYWKAEDAEHPIPEKYLKQP